MLVSLAGPLALSKNLLLLNRLVLWSAGPVGTMLAWALLHLRAGASPAVYPEQALGV